MASDWSDYGLESGQARTGWTDFYGTGGKSWALDEKLLRDYFGTRPFRIRYVICSGGWWLIGSDGVNVRAVFEGQDGDDYEYPGDGPLGVNTVMAYLVRNRSK
jgi:hypothetical protein